MKKLIALVLPASAVISPSRGQAGARPVRLGIAGLSHDHVHGILGRGRKEISSSSESGSRTRRWPHALPRATGSIPSSSSPTWQQCSTRPSRRPWLPLVPLPITCR